MGQAFPNTIGRAAAVTAPGLMVLAIILFMGKVSGAHLNPAVSLAFAARGDFPWRRVPGYVIVQLAGATLAALFLRGVIDVSASFGSNYPAAGYSSMAAFWMELILTFGLVSVILGTASGAENIGIVGAFGVGSYIALAGLSGSPISGTSMNLPGRRSRPRRSRLDRLLGVRRRADRRRDGRRRRGIRAPRRRGRQGWLGRRPRRPVHRGHGSERRVRYPSSPPEGREPSPGGDTKVSGPDRARLETRTTALTVRPLDTDRRQTWQQDGMFLYIGTYPSEADARADYDIVKDLHTVDVVGTYDAAVITKDS